MPSMKMCTNIFSQKIRTAKSIIKKDVAQFRCRYRMLPSANFANIITVYLNFRQKSTFTVPCVVLAAPQAVSKHLREAGTIIGKVSMPGDLALDLLSYKLASNYSFLHSTYTKFRPSKVQLRDRQIDGQTNRQTGT